jgi:D-hydroxyproline dehydrogenase subunit gamma
MEPASLGLRIEGEQRAQPVTILFEGKAVGAFAGETLAVALFASGQSMLGTNPIDGTPVGLFCAMGVCQECLVLVDGVLTEACRTPVRAGMVVQRAP